MDWNQFQQIIELLFKRFSTSFKLDQDLIEFTIEERTVVYTRQEYEDICNSLMSFAQSPTYLSKSDEIEIIIDLVDSRSAIRFQSDVLTNGDDKVSYRVSAPSDELLLSFLSSIPKEEIRAFRRNMPTRYILQRSYNDGEEIQLFDLIRRVLRLSFSMRIKASENTSVERLQRYVKVSNHHFKWWFANSPIRAEYMRRLKAGVASHSCFFRLKRPIRFLLFVHGFFGLTPDVFFHGFFVHVSDRRYIVPSGPKTSVPFTPQFWMLIEDHQRRLSFEIPHKI